MLVIDVSGMVALKWPRCQTNRQPGHQSLQLLTVVLRGQQAEWTGWNIVCFRDLEGLALASIIKNAPVDGAHPSRACSTIKTFNLNS
jgi:hypothetical protein